MPSIAITQLSTAKKNPSNSESLLDDLTKDAQIHINAGFRGADVTTMPVGLMGSPYPSTE